MAFFVPNFSFKNFKNNDKIDVINVRLFPRKE